MTDWEPVVRGHGPLVGQTAWRLLGPEFGTASLAQGQQNQPHPCRQDARYLLTFQGASLLPGAASSASQLPALLDFGRTCRLAGNGSTSPRRGPTVR